MVEANNPDATAEELPILWTAAIRGVLGTSAQTTQARLPTDIDRAFDQSAYLNR